MKLIDFPNIIILSTQRSGTHLLESFLKNHPDINGRGEIFLRYERNGIVGENVPGKNNVAILMYNQMNVFESLAGDFKNHKIIHLLRDPSSVALSRCQMLSDKQLFGEAYEAHLLADKVSVNSGLSLRERKSPILKYYEKFKKKAEEDQKFYCEVLRSYDHLQLRYEDFVPNNTSIEFLDDYIVKKLSLYLNLDEAPLHLRTNYMKTGIVS